MKGILNETEINPEKVKTFDQSLYVQHLLIFEIFNNLPRLEENEKKIRENVIKDAIFRKDRLKDYYELIKKKYTNFIQLAYVDDELLHEFYNYQFAYDSQKNNFIQNFDLIKFLQNFYRGPKGNSITMAENEFKRVVENRLMEISPEEEEQRIPLWNNICFNELFADKKNNEVLLNLVKYNPDFTSESVILDIKLIYPQIENDLSSILSHRKRINEVIIDFSEKKFTYDKKIKPQEYENEEDYQEDINKIISVIFSILKGHTEIRSLCLISTKFQIVLNERNAASLSSLIGKDHQISIFSMKNLVVPKTSRMELVKATYANKLIKFLHIEGTPFEDMELNDFEQHFNENSKVCYVSFDSDHIVENLIEESNH